MYRPSFYIEEHLICQVLYAEHLVYHRCAPPFLYLKPYSLWISDYDSTVGGRSIGTFTLS